MTSRREGVENYFQINFKKTCEKLKEFITLHPSRDTLSGGVEKKDKTRS
jgi:hypothetical protein